MTASPQPVPILEAAIDLLRQTRRPMTVAEITDSLLETDGVQLGGLTPQATVAARLYSEAKRPQGRVELVGRATFTLREATASSP